MVGLILNNPRNFQWALALVSAAALSAALIGQYGFNLHPCHLCILQRIPYGVVIGLGVIAALRPAWSLGTIALSALAFLVNSGIAFYHAGVEQKWWAGLSGCSTPDMSGSIEELMARIEAAKGVPCDQIAWSLFGITMAGYNVMLCLALAGLSVWYVTRALKR